MKPITIAHVDDSPAYSNQFRKTFASAIAEVVSFGTGEEARDFVSRGEADVLVVDQSGFRFATDVHKAALVKSIVVLSGSPEKALFDAELKLRKLDEGCVARIKALIERISFEMTDVDMSTVASQNLVADLSPGLRSQYAGQVLVLSGSPESIVFSSPRLADAEDFIRANTGETRRFRIVQAPPEVEMSLAEMEMD